MLEGSGEREENGGEGKEEKAKFCFPFHFGSQSLEREGKWSSGMEREESINNWSESGSECVNSEKGSSAEAEVNQFFGWG